MKKRSILNRLQLAQTMMWAAILLIIAFQSYWINRLYKEEKEAVRKEANTIFRDVVYNLRVERLKKDSNFFRSSVRPDLFTYDAISAVSKKLTLKKKDSGSVKINPDSTMRIEFVKGHQSDTLPPIGMKNFIFSSNGQVPPELRELMLKRASGGNMGRIVFRDSSVVKDLPQDRGISIMVNRSAKNDTLKKADGKENKVVGRPRIARVLPPGSRVSVPLPQMGEQFSVKLDGPERSIIRMFTNGGLEDTLSLPKLDSAYRKELSKASISLAFSIKTGKYDSLHKKDTLLSTSFATRPATVGFYQPNWYQAELENPAAFLLKKISPQILFSVFLAAFTTVAFIFLYRNLAAQRRLTEMKNDFISNITHELKTPIATVSVAVEALRNFGGIQSPERTKEYLDISASELQRLGLLVDKVLKLSLFENRELDLKKEPFDLKSLTEEVLNTMKLQFEKHHAKLNFSVQGGYFTIDADRLHIISVIYNLLDNALKYSKDKPEIDVRLRHTTDIIELEVADKGIGIADGFQSRIFDKFFRVPTGDHHNIKGYGLGLCYVAHVVKKHGGTIHVESEPGKGSTFTIKLPVA